jgi:hypothetical protein
MAGQFRVQTPAKATDYLFSKTFRPAIKVTQLHIQRVPRFCTGVKLPEYEADHSCSFSAHVTNEWSNSPIPLIYPHGMGTGNSNLLLLLLKK